MSHRPRVAARPSACDSDARTYGTTRMWLERARAVDRETAAQQDGEFVGSYRSTEIVSLSFRAAVCNQEFMLRSCFNALRDCPPAWPAAHRGHGADNAGSVSSGCNVAHE